MKGRTLVRPEPLPLLPALAKESRGQFLSHIPLLSATSCSDDGELPGTHRAPCRRNSRPSLITGAVSLLSLSQTLFCGHTEPLNPHPSMGPLGCPASPHLLTVSMLSRKLSHVSSAQALDPFEAQGVGCTSLLHKSGSTLGLERPRMFTSFVQSGHKPLVLGNSYWHNSPTLLSQKCHVVDKL